MTIRANMPMIPNAMMIPLIVWMVLTALTAELAATTIHAIMPMIPNAMTVPLIASMEPIVPTVEIVVIQLTELHAQRLDLSSRTHVRQS